jgi:hypothetical protein
MDTVVFANLLFGIEELLTEVDYCGRKLLIQEPKSGRDAEIAFMPEHIAGRLAEYITVKQSHLPSFIHPSRCL